jgi:4-hydroxyacetophenone monooxygenase
MERAKRMPEWDLDDALDAALKDAHLPALAVTLAHLTGDEGFLKAEWRPRYIPYTDNRMGGLSLPAQDQLRAMARRALREHGIGQKGGAKLAPLSTAKLQTLMNFVAGAEVPERYLPLMLDELGLGENGELQTPFAVKTSAAAAAGLRVVVVGAGMSGILAAIQLKQAGIGFTLIERNADVGGTWYENIYPGCRVDSQNHIYSYSFIANHDWPQHFSTQGVLLAYFKDCVDKFGLHDHLRLNTAVEKAVFDSTTQKWQVHTKDADGKRTIITADAVITAVGQLNKPKIPDYPGRDNFRGPQFHSARWRKDVSLRGKRVAIVGTGASSYQFAPAVAREAAHLTVYQRSAPWMAPTPDYHFDVGEGQKWLLHHLPGYASWYRFWLFWTITDGVYEAVKVDPAFNGNGQSISAANQTIRETLTAYLKAQIGERTDLIDKVVPKYPFGSKRTLRDCGEWIPMLKRDNAELVTEKITAITQDCIITADGREHPTDVIIYGTGFHASRFLEPLQIVGPKGAELTAQWAGDARAYLGMTVPDYPNFFCIYGPNTNLVVNGSIVFFSECSMRYILGCLELLAEKGAATMAPRKDVFDRYNARVDAGNARMAWGQAGVSNWYKNDSGRVTQNWPFPLVEYWEATRAPNPDDFIFQGSRGGKAG